MLGKQKAIFLLPLMFVKQIKRRFHYVHFNHFLSVRLSLDVIVSERFFAFFCGNHENISIIKGKFPLKPIVARKEKHFFCRKKVRLIWMENSQIHTQKDYGFVAHVNWV